MTMRSRIMGSVLAGSLSLTVMATVVRAEGAAPTPPPVRSGVKTTEPIVVAYVESTAMLDELEGRAIDALRKLAQDAGQAGLTVIPQFLLRIDLPQTMEGNAQVAWEAQIPVANECPKEGGRDFGSFKLKTVDPLRVAYTFHQGNPQGIEYTIQMLLGWMMQKGLAPGGKVTFVSRSDPTNTPESEMIIEVRIDTNAA